MPAIRDLHNRLGPHPPNTRTQRLFRIKPLIYSSASVVGGGLAGAGVAAAVAGITCAHLNSFADNSTSCPPLCAHRLTAFVCPQYQSHRRGRWQMATLGLWMRQVCVSAFPPLCACLCLLCISLTRLSFPSLYLPFCFFVALTDIPLFAVLHR